MTRLYILDVRGLDWKALLPELPMERQKKVLACRREGDKARSVGAGWLLQEALKRENIEKNRQIFAKNPMGKPYLTGFPQLHFSLSHSGPWVVCAVGEHPLGVDVEALRCTPELARRFFCPVEQSTDAVALTRIWVAKEAFTKALGTGLTTDFRQFTVELGEPPRLHQTLVPQPYRLHEYTLEDYRLCLCSLDTEKPDVKFLSI